MEATECLLRKQTVEPPVRPKTYVKDEELPDPPSSTTSITKTT